MLDHQPQSAVKLVIYSRRDLYFSFLSKSVSHITWGGKAGAQHLNTFSALLWDAHSLYSNRCGCPKYIFLLTLIKHAFQTFFKHLNFFKHSHLNFVSQQFNLFCGWSTVSDTHRNIFGILLSKTVIRLYLSFSDWFGSKRKSVWLQINRKMVNTIWFLRETTILMRLLSTSWYTLTPNGLKID